MLNLVKTLQEIDDIDIAQIEKLITLAGIVRSASNLEEDSSTKSSNTISGNNVQNVQDSMQLNRPSDLNDLI